MIKKILTLTAIIFASSCGFKPMLKNYNNEKIIFKKITYSGTNELTYLLQSFLNLEENSKTNKLVINLEIAESQSSTKRNLAGITIEESLTISVSYNIQKIENDGSYKTIMNESTNETKVLLVTDSFGSDENKKRIEKSQIIKNLSQKIKFKLLLVSQKSNDF